MEIQQIVHKNEPTKFTSFFWFSYPMQCSPDYAYGPSGFPAWGINPNSCLVFEIEVLSVD